MTEINANIQPDTPQEIKDAQVNQSLQQINNKFLTNVIKDETGTPRILIGKQQDGFGSGRNHGIKVSQSGVDVRTAADDDLVMSSAFNMLKIVASGTVTVASVAPVGAGANSEETVVNHNLGYTPGFIYFVQSPYNASDEWGNGAPEARTTAGDDFLGTVNYVFANSSDITFRVTHFDSTATDGDFKFRYYLFRETADGS